MKVKSIADCSKIGFQDRVSLNVGQKYCRILQREHSAILLTFIKLPFVIKTCVESISEWPFYTCLTVCGKLLFGLPAYTTQACLGIHCPYSFRLFALFTINELK